MSDKEIGLIKKYHVVKLSNPEKPIDAIVLEFDDHLSRQALKAYSEVLMDHGDYIKFALDILNKIDTYDKADNEHWYTNSAHSNIYLKLLKEREKTAKLEKQLKITDNERIVIAIQDLKDIHFETYKDYAMDIPQNARDSRVRTLVSELLEKIDNGEQNER